MPTGETFCISVFFSLVFNSSLRDAVEARGHFAQDGRSPGNENRRWHGTTRECRLGDNGQTQFCSSASCSLCSIMIKSYDINLW